MKKIFNLLLVCGALMIIGNACASKSNVKEEATQDTIVVTDTTMVADTVYSAVVEDTVAVDSLVADTI